MAIVFPASPNLNEIFTEGSISYKCVGTDPIKWIGLGITPADRLVEGSNSLEINANNDLVWTGSDVGIGTNAPGSDGGTTLEIYNATTPTLKLNDGDEYKALLQLRGNDLEIRGSNGLMEFYTGNVDGASSTKRLSIDSSGRTLIHTSTSAGYADRWLSIGDVTDASSTLEIRSSPTNGYSNIVFTDATSADSNSYIGAIEYAHQNNTLAFKTNALERLRITSDGSIEIDSFNNADAGYSLRTGFLPSAFGGSGIMAKDHSGSSRDGCAVYGHDGISFYTSGSTSQEQRMLIRKDGYINAGGFIGSGYHRLNGINSTSGSAVFVVSGYQISGGTNQDSIVVAASSDSAQPNSSTSILRVFRHAANQRSINAAGSINASGADYAEYMTKAGNFTIDKGALCGIDSEGKLTNVFADAISFVVKSTDPSYVGGDVWHETVGAEPGGYDDDRTEEEIAAAKVVYEEALETARQFVDRIAFSGQVPINVIGATPGQYIIPVTTIDGGITGEAKNEDDLTLVEYMKAVGKVIAIEDDGRARIIVKVS